ETRFSKNGTRFKNSLGRGNVNPRSLRPARAIRTFRNLRTFFGIILKIFLRGNWKKRWLRARRLLFRPIAPCSPTADCTRLSSIIPRLFSDEPGPSAKFSIFFTGDPAPRSPLLSCLDRLDPARAPWSKPVFSHFSVRSETQRGRGEWRSPAREAELP